MLSEHIEYLVRGNDCVIVPGWGALVAHYQPAVLNSETGVITPPYRSLAFNPALTHNDGLVAASIARREKITYDKAVEIVTEEVTALRHQIEDSGEIALGRLGSFRKNNGGTTIFEPFAASAHSSEFNALKPLSVIPVLTQARLDAGLTPTGEEPRKKDVVYLSFSRNIFKAAASVAVLLGLGFVFSTPMIVDNATSYASIANSIEIKAPSTTMNPPVVVVSPISQAETVNTEVKPVENVEPIVKNCPTSTSTDVQPIIVVSEPQHEATAIRFNDTDRYCLIVASLTTLEDAEEYVVQHGKHLKLGILEKEGRYRIYAATGETSSQAMAAKKNDVIAHKYDNAWVCRR